MIKIKNDSCTKCKRCIQICSPKIFMFSNIDNEVKIQNIESCTECGHCVGVCPTASVQHSLFPPKKVHKIQRDLLPTPDQVLLLCQTRRSNRAFSNKDIPLEDLLKIIEAAHTAPTATNSQNVSYTLVTKPEQLTQITKYTLDALSSVVKLVSNPFLKPILKKMMPEVYKLIPKFTHLIESHKNNHDLILRGAKAVLFIHTPEKSRFGCQDSNLAYQNASLMAESLGISQFYTGFVCAGIGQDKKKKIAKLLGVQGKIHAGMALGIPSFKFENYIDKKEVDLVEA